MFNEIHTALTNRRISLGVQKFKMNKTNLNLPKSKLLQKFVGDRSVTMNEMMYRGRAIAIMRDTWINSL